MRRIAIVVLLLIAPVSAQTAEQVHLSLDVDDAGHAVGLVVQWSTDLPYPDAVLPPVTYSIHGGPEQEAAAARAGTAKAYASLPEIQNGQPPVTQRTVYAATIPAPPGANVTYAIGDSATYTTRMVPAANDPIRVAAFADIGRPSSLGRQAEGDPSFANVENLVALRPHLLIIPGDLAYGDTGYQHRAWDEFMRNMEPIFSTVPTMPVPGNHEWEQEPITGEYEQFTERWVLPGSEVDYAFRAGPVAFTAANSDGICTRAPLEQAEDPQRAPCPRGQPDEARLATLRQGLQAAQESLWSMVYFHHPPYSHYYHDDDERTKQLWMPSIEELGADVVVTGHGHAYQRSHALREGHPVDAANITDGSYLAGHGPLHVVTGGGGATLYEPLNEPPPAWLATNRTIHHVTIFDIDADAIRGQAIDVQGVVIDSFTIHKQAPPTDPETESTPWPWWTVLLLVALGRWR